MSKKHLRSPRKRDVTQGNIIDIIDKDDNRIGRAELISRCPSKYVQDGLPYVKFERGNPTYGDTMYIWAKERWATRWEEHSYYRPGDCNCTDVHYYVGTSSDHPSHFDYYDDISRSVSSTGKFIFIEESGVMVSSTADYPKQAVKALNRVCKSFGGDLVVFGHNQLHIRERFAIEGVKPRILAFLDTSVSFEEAVKEFLSAQEEVEDYMLLVGISAKEEKTKTGEVIRLLKDEDLDFRAIKIDPNIGLRLKKSAEKT